MNILESNIRFSQSRMWRDQKQYYDEKGIDAWKDDVPFYITSNPFIAHTYAQVAIAFIQDYCRQNPDAKNHPFTFLELGSGTGQFSFYFLKNLTALQATLQLTEIKIRYVMSDISTKSFAFWEAHPQLQNYLASGILDFAVYDLYESDTIRLHRAKTTVTEQDIQNPLVIIANYIFDSIATDIFTVEDGKLYESLATVKMPDDNQDWKKAKITYKESLIEKPYYGNEIDDILFAYQEKLIDTHFQFPIASLNALKNFQTLSNNRFLLLTSDKGCTALEELDHCDYPELDFHGSFSVMMNYHALGEFCQKNHGAFFTQAFREHIVSGVYACGFSFENCPQVQLQSQQMIHGFSPTDYFIIYEHIIEHYKKCSLEVMASYLNLSQWDPYLFEEIAEKLADLAEKGSPDVVSFLGEHMHHIADNFYYLPSSEDVFFSIGVFFQNVGRFEDALHYYGRSLHYFGEDEVTLYNMGMCCHSLGRKADAIHYLEKAK